MNARALSRQVEKHKIWEPRYGNLDEEFSLNWFSSPLSVKLFNHPEYLNVISAISQQTIKEKSKSKELQGKTKENQFSTKKYKCPNILVKDGQIWT